MSTPALTAAANDFGHRPAGALRVREVGGHTFEAGGHLPHVEIAYETWGRLNAAGDNVVLVAHALTGDSHVATTEADPSPGWWEALVGPGRPVDTDRWFVVAPAMVGGCYGSTGPASADPDGRPWGSRFPFVTIRDAVRLERRLLGALGVTRLQAVIGGSMGGARALEWAATFPEMVAGVGVFACGAETTAEQIAFGQAQIKAIENDPDFAGGDYYGLRPPLQGLALARRIAHITYRSEQELGFRFGREKQGSEEPLGAAGRRTGRYQVESYLDHQATKLISRFDPNAYLVVAEALISHDVGRGRGGAARALGRVAARPLIVAVDSDRLYLPAQSEELARMIPGDHRVRMISSPIGHDGFLTSAQQLGDEIRQVLRL
ncbi:MAG: homoserine O-acetyltransferase [Nesterenkonia sp.]|uniref:homoserine O-acetyltransferase MetX n=1 Tax=Nesterenkonia marinintestina TaxID=2979865 RepID=UPI0021C10DCA|nr:homoserine O-acetyltransferase [Nesterenkonia sp. GX14115]MDO5492397.1 homoserine O-acetyltransferase [Nesterenkonia sp.]